MAHCEKWLRLMLAGSPNPACLPRGLRALMSLHTCSLLKTQHAAWSSSDFAALPSSSVNRVFAAPSARVSSTFLPLSILKKLDAFHRPLPPIAVILAVDLSTWSKLIGQTAWQLLPSFHVPPYTGVEDTDRSHVWPSLRWLTGSSLVDAFTFYQVCSSFILTCLYFVQHVGFRIYISKNTHMGLVLS